MKYKIDFTKPVQTRDGRPVRIISTDGHQNYPIVGYIANDISPVCWTKEGNLWLFDTPDERDLINVPQKRTLDIWVNVYAKEKSFTYSTKEEADNFCGPGRIACLHIVREYEEGEGLQ